MFLRRKYSFSVNGRVSLFFPGTVLSCPARLPFCLVALTATLASEAGDLAALPGHLGPLLGPS